MCEVWAQGTFFEAVCTITNPRTGSRFKVPFFPIYYHDTLGTRKPLGVPLDRSTEVEGPLIFVGFGITKADDGWDDYGGGKVQDDIVVVLGDVPKRDYSRFPRETYASSDYKVSNAVNHGAKGVVLVSDPFREPGSEPTPVTRGEEALGVFIPTFYLNLVLGELQRGFDLSTLRRQVEERRQPQEPFPLNLRMTVSYKGNEFREKASEHFIYLFHPGSLAERELTAIVEKREEAYASITHELGVDFREKVRFFLFPSAREKTFYTGHVGGGSASGRTMLEIYNAEIKLDPWHELIHILTGSINRDPASVLEEGLAIYIVRRMGGVEKQIDCEAAGYKKRGELIPLRELFDIEIGTQRSKPEISYPESGSLVKYLVKRWGMQKFQELYAAVHRAQSIDEKDRKVRETYGRTIDEIEQEWLESFGNGDPA